MDSIKIIFEATDAAAEKTLKDMAKGLDGVTEAAKKTNKEASLGDEVFKNLFGTMTAANLATKAITMAWDFLVTSFKKGNEAAAEAEMVFARVEATLQSTGRSAEFSADQLADMAQSFSFGTMFDDEQILEAMNTLLRFDSVTKESLPKITQLAIDMAAAMGTDVATAANQLGGALETGVIPKTIKLDAETKKLFASYVALGDESAALGVMVDALGERFAGQAEKMGATATGAAARVKIAWENSLEASGTARTEDMQQFNTWLAALIEGSNQEFEIRRRAIEILHEQGDATAQLQAGTQDIIGVTKEAADAALEAARAEKEHAEMIMQVNQNMDDLQTHLAREYNIEVDSSDVQIATEDLEKMREEMERAALTARQEFFASIQAGQTAFEDLQDAQEKYQTELAALEEQYRLHQITEQEFADGVDRVTQAFNEAKEKGREWAINFVVDMAMARAAADGVITDSEFAQILGFMEGAGVLAPGMAEVMAKITDAISRGDYEAAIEFWNAFVAGAGAADELEDTPLTPEERRAMRAEPPVPAPSEVPPPASTNPAAEMFTAIGNVDPEQANALRGLFGSLGVLDPEAMAAGVALFDAITAVDATSLFDAVEAVKYLVSQDGKTITIYVVQSGSAPTGSSPTSSTTTSTPQIGVTPVGNPAGLTLNNYGSIYADNLEDVFAQLR